MECHARTEVLTKLCKVKVAQDILAAATAFADRHDITVGELIEIAVVTFLINKDVQGDLARVEVCAVHGCFMERNSSGTAIACPVEEGSPESAIYLNKL